MKKDTDSINIGSYLVLQVLGLEKDLLNVAKDDVIDRKIQEAKLTVKERAPEK